MSSREKTKKKTFYSYYISHLPINNFSIPYISSSNGEPAVCRLDHEFGIAKANFVTKGMSKKNENQIFRWRKLLIN